MGSANTADSSNTLQSSTPSSTSTCSNSPSISILRRCPVCFELIFVPVVLPCSHEICKACFDLCLENGLLKCPLCRYRISSWARRCKDRVVNQDRVKAIEEADLSSLSQSLYIDDEVIHTTYKPGELHEEYLQEMQKVVQEDMDRETLDRDSALRLEQQDRQEMMRMTHQADHDREIAVKLCKELNGEGSTTSQAQTPVSAKGCRSHVSPSTPSRVNGLSTPKVLHKKGTSKGSASKSTIKKRKSHIPSKDAASFSVTDKENSLLSHSDQTQLHFLFSKEAERLKNEDYRLALSIREEQREVNSQQKKGQNSAVASKSCGVLKYFHSCN